MVQDKKDSITLLLLILLFLLFFKKRMEDKKREEVSTTIAGEPVCGGIPNCIGPALTLSDPLSIRNVMYSCPEGSHVETDSQGNAWCIRD